MKPNEAGGTTLTVISSDSRRGSINRRIHDLWPDFLARSRTAN